MSEPIHAARVTRGPAALISAAVRRLITWHVECLACDWHTTTMHHREIVGLVTQHNVEVHNRQ